LAQDIIDIAEISKSVGIDCWLNYGALLGIVRENRLLPWNNDAEISCWYTDGIEKRLVQLTDKLNNLGYNCFYYSSIGSLCIKHKNNIININCYFVEGNNVVRPHETASNNGKDPILARIFYWLAIFMCSYPQKELMSGFNISKSEFIKRLLINIFRIVPKKVRTFSFFKLISVSKFFGGKYEKTSIPKHFFDELVLKDFYSTQLLVPKKSKELLSFIYGETWNIQKDNWSFYDNKNKSTTKIKFIKEVFDYKKIDFV
jgi:hypothetical protein